MGGNEEKDASPDHDGAESDREHDRPAHAARAMAQFKSANAVRRGRVDHARLDPLLQLLLDLFGDSHRGNCKR